MSQNKFFKGLSLLILLNILVKPIWIFFVDRQVQNLSGHDNYGTYFSVFSLSIVLGFIADAGISTMMNRQLAMSLPAKVSQLFNYKLALSFVFLSAFFLICYLTGVKNWKLVILVGLIQLLNSFVIFFRSVITANQKFGTDSWISVLDKLLVVIFLVPFLYLFTRQGEEVLFLFLYTQAGSLLITVCIAGYLAGKPMNGNGRNTHFKEVLKLTLPFVILIALMGVHNRLDMFLLERIHIDGAHEAGVYAAAFRLLDAGNMMGYLSASFLLPFVARHLGNKAMIDPVVFRLRHSLLNITLMAAVFCLFYADWVILILYHIQDRYYEEILILCMFSLPAYMIIHIYGSLLTAAGKFKTFTAIMVGTVLLNIGLNVFLAGKYGSLACVSIALFTQYLLAALCYWKAVRRLKLSFASGPFLFNLAFVVIMSLLFYGMKELEAGMGLVLLAAGVVSALIMFVQTKMIRIFD